MELFDLLEELRVMAQTGKNFADDPYDEERYERILELVSECYGESFDLPPEEVRDRLSSKLGQETPKVAADGAVFNPKGEILLMKRADTATWCIPGGALKALETPEEGAVRETYEETGLKVEVNELTGVYTNPPGVGGTPHNVVVLVYLCEKVGGELEVSHEGLDVAYREIDEVDDWFGGHEDFVRDAYEAWK